jgi:hypothetical protein
MVLATGEKVSPTHYQRWLSLCDHDVLWCNAYGPTEATVTATVFIPPANWGWRKYADRQTAARVYRRYP